MSEEKKTEELNSNDFEEMAKKEREASEAEAKKIATETEAKVRAEIQQEQSMADLKKQNEDLAKKLEENQKTQNDTVAQMTSSFEQKLKDVMDSQKSVVKTDNPYQGREPDNNGPNLKDPNNVTQIEDASRDAFLKKHNIVL